MHVEARYTCDFQCDFWWEFAYKTRLTLPCKNAFFAKTKIPCGVGWGRFCTQSRITIVSKSRGNRMCKRAFGENWKNASKSIELLPPLLLREFVTGTTFLQSIWRFGCKRHFSLSILPRYRFNHSFVYNYLHYCIRAELLPPWPVSPFRDKFVPSVTFFPCPILAVIWGTISYTVPA